MYRSKSWWLHRMKSKNLVNATKKHWTIHSLRCSFKFHFGVLLRYLLFSKLFVYVLTSESSVSLKKKSWPTVFIMIKGKSGYHVERAGIMWKVRVSCGIYYNSTLFYECVEIKRSIRWKWSALFSKNIKKYYARIICIQ